MRLGELLAADVVLYAGEVHPVLVRVELVLVVRAVLAPALRSGARRVLERPRRTGPSGVLGVSNRPVLACRALRVSLWAHRAVAAAVRIPDLPTVLGVGSREGGRVHGPEVTLLVDLHRHPPDRRRVGLAAAAIRRRYRGVRSRRWGGGNRSGDDRGWPEQGGALRWPGAARRGQQPQHSKPHRPGGQGQGPLFFSLICCVDEDNPPFGGPG